MKDIPHPQLLSKFGPKTWKSPVTSTCPKNLYYQKRHLGPLGVNTKLNQSLTPFEPELTPFEPESQHADQEANIEVNLPLSKWIATLNIQASIEFKKFSLLDCWISHPAHNLELQNLCTHTTKLKTKYQVKL